LKCGTGLSSIEGVLSLGFGCFVWIGIVLLARVVSENHRCKIKSRKLVASLKLSVMLSSTVMRRYTKDSENYNSSYLKDLLCSSLVVMQIH
jgi:hypothetical protein